MGRRTVTQRAYEERILRVLVHIQANLDHTVDLDELAGLAHFSLFHFHRVFTGMVGETVMQHVRRLRLERAAVQLKTVKRPVTQIAFEAGYETHEAFTRAFRATFDASPTEYRRRNRGSGPRPAPCGVHYSPEGVIDRFRPVTTEVVAMNVRIEELPPTRVAFMRHTGPHNQVGATWHKFMMFVFSRGLFGGGKVFAAVHDDPNVTPADRLRYDVCVGVGDGFQPDGEVGCQQIGGGPYAVTSHRGPYDRLGETYAGLMGQWLPAHDREPAAGPCLEFYLNNPQQVAPADLMTEIYVPLRPMGKP